MNDSQVLSDLNDSPENSSAPHSWVRQHGGKHRDFSASRLQARERARQRVQRAIQEERELAREQAENWRAAGLRRPLPPAMEAPQSAVAELEVPAAPPETPAALPVAAANEALPMQPELAPAAEPAGAEPPADDPARPAWLAPGSAEMAAYPLPHAPADTLQGVRDRLASRWFALKGLHGGTAGAAEAQPVSAASVASPAPVLAVFSLAGGVGKSSLAATLSRVLSSRGERVLMVETTPFSLLPFFFGARDRRPGVLRTFAPPETCNDAPVQMIALDTDLLPAGSSGDDPLITEISRYAGGASRVIVDISTASAAVARRIMRLSPLVLVPVVPDMNSVVNAGFIDAFFQRHDDPLQSSEVYYVLNRFNPSLPLHLDVREVLRERLGGRLLPFALHRAPAVSEALAEGMTVVDYAPTSAAAEEFSSLAAWVKARSAPAGMAARAARWIEK